MSPTERLDEHSTALKAAVERLRESVEAWCADRDAMSRDSMIKRFEFTFELSWKSMRDWLRIWEGDLAPGGPRQTIEGAIARNLVLDGNVWTEMLQKRNRSVHIYDEGEITRIAEWIAEHVLEPTDALIVRLADKV